MLIKRLRKKIAPTKDPLADVLAFLPILEAGKLKKASGYYNKTGENMPEVEKLRKALLASGLVGGTEWLTYTERMQHLLTHPAEIDSLPAAEMKILVTTLCHLDRIAETLLPYACQKGAMTSTVRRLKTLHEEGAFR